jgi:ParB-like nuclease domain
MVQLARDIKRQGQLEPIILHEGLILDGRNRYRACQIAGVNPRTGDFGTLSTQRCPEEFVVSRNLRRRHLSLGQKAAIALEGSAHIELSADPREAKRDLSEVAKKFGINERRVFEVRPIRNVRGSLYQSVKPVFAASRVRDKSAARTSIWCD